MQRWRLAEYSHARVPPRALQPTDLNVACVPTAGKAVPSYWPYVAFGNAFRATLLETGLAKGPAVSFTHTARHSDGGVLAAPGTNWLPTTRR
jgi:hypothetical protein